MTTAELTYVAVWPIVDRTRPPAALIAEACRDLDVMAELAGARIVSVPQWSISTGLDRLVCHALARTSDASDDDALPSGKVTAAVRDQIHRLAMNNWTVRAIAEAVSVSPTTASRYAAQVRTPGRA